MKRHLPVFLLLASCAPALGGPRIEREKFGALPDGTAVDLYVLSNDKGMTAKITNYGGTLTSLVVPDKGGKPVDVVLGYDDLKSYLDGKSYFGATIGRVANRIAGGKFKLDGQEFKLDVNAPPNTLHGGKKGFDKVVWKAVPSIYRDSAKLTLEYISKNGEEGFPGTVHVTVVYVLKDKALGIEYLAYADKPTPLNLTNHSYFNLDGHNSGTVLEHQVMIQADSYTPTDKTLIPSGAIAPVRDTVLDFTNPVAIGKGIKETGLDPVGYDHNFVLRGPRGELSPAAEVSGGKSGITMKLSTTEPGVQFYTGNHLGKEVGKGGAKYPQYAAFCLETQHFPDSPNQQDNRSFPNVILRPGRVYTQRTLHEFSAK